MMDTRINRVIVEDEAASSEMTQKVLKKLHGLPMGEAHPDGFHHKSESLDFDKKTLRLVSFKGEILKPCPGTSGYICCGYQILNMGTNCPMDCSYCILQAYFNEPSLRIFVNVEERLEYINELIESQPENIFRIGTGEFTDSLSHDHIVGWTDILLPFFAGKKNAVLELKTKSNRIDGLLSNQEGRDRIIVSWSLNSPYISNREEKGAPSIEKRLQAAKRCQQEGYTIGFHFDPLIEHPNWQVEYKKTLEMMDRYINPKGIIWISLGCLRYIPVLKTIIRERHPKTHILDGEFIPGLDGKMRYFKPLRIDIYSFMAEILKKWHQKVGIYLCMESDEVWYKSLGWSPKDSQGLSQFLDGRVREVFG